MPSSSSPTLQIDIMNLEENEIKALKYHQLLKLCRKHNLKKQWAKKDDLIKHLLSLKVNNIKKVELHNNDINEDIEWINASDVINNLSTNKKEEIKSTRGTFVIEKEPLNDSRATYNLKEAISDILPDLNDQPIDSRLTFDVQQVDSRLTFDVPKKMSSSVRRSSRTDGNASRETFTISATGSGSTPIVTNAIKHVMPPRQSQGRPLIDQKIKMLTVPISKVSSSRVVGGKARPGKESPLKLSQRSIAIKRTKEIMSPIRTAARSFIGDKQRGSLNQPLRPSLPNKSSPVVKSVPQKLDNKENRSIKVEKRPSVMNRSISSPQVIGRRKSKSDDPMARRRSGLSIRAEFQTPPPQATNAIGKKTSGSKKVPNFAAIHQRQFNKMDSLDTYIAKKEERAKMLFGSPVEKVMKVKGNQLEEVKEEESTMKHVAQKIITKTTKPVQTTKGLESARKMINKTPSLKTQTEIKDKTRSHIHNVRTNRRFELQKKFRNM